MRIATFSSSRIADTWSAVRQRAAALWLALPPAWRSDASLMAVAAVMAFALLAAFHQVVHAGVDRAAARDLAAYRHQALAAACSVERRAEARALCLLTTSTAPRDTHVAVAR